MQRSHVSLEKWIHAVYLWKESLPEFRSPWKKLSSVRLASEIGVTQKTSWRMILRIRGIGTSQLSHDQSDFLFRLGEILVRKSRGFSGNTPSKRGTGRK